MITGTILSLSIISAILVVYWWFKSLRKPKKVDLTDAPKAIQEIAKEPEKFHFVKYRHGIIKMKPEEYKLFVGANRRTRNIMLKMAFQGKDFTKHF